MHLCVVGEEPGAIAFLDGLLDRGRHGKDGSPVVAEMARLAEPGVSANEWLAQLIATWLYNLLQSLRLYDLRHTCCTLLLMAGVNGRSSPSALATLERR